MSEANLSEVTVRKAEREDIPAVLELITALADFEKLTPPDADARARFERDGWPTDGTLPRFQAWIAFVRTGDPDDGTLTPAAYAITFETYSSFLARPTLYLEDIFVLEEYRRMAVGSAIMERLQAEAETRGCGRMEWVVLDWNVNAQRFYQKLGARHLTEWHYYRKEITL